MADNHKRFRNNSGRLMLELLYGEADWIERVDGTVKYPYTQCATAMQIRPNRQIECLNWLQETGLIVDLTIGRTHATMSLMSPVGFSRGDQGSIIGVSTPKGALPWQV